MAAQGRAASTPLLTSVQPSFLSYFSSFLLCLSRPKASSPSSPCSPHWLPEGRVVRTQIPSVPVWALAAAPHSLPVGGPVICCQIVFLLQHKSVIPFSLFPNLAQPSFGPTSGRHADVRGPVPALASDLPP